MTGVISPEKLASMKPEEMASKQLQELRKKFTKEAINDHQMAQNEGTMTDMFTCGKERFTFFWEPFRKNQAFLEFTFLQSWKCMGV